MKLGSTHLNKLKILINGYLIGGNTPPFVKRAKEFMEVHFDEKTIVIEDYKSLKAYGVKINSFSSSIRQKGQLEELDVLYDALKKEKDNWPIELWDMIQTTEISFKII